MKEVLVKGFNDEALDHIYGKEVFKYKRTNPWNSKLSEKLVYVLDEKDNIFKKDLLGRTVYVPPVHMKMYNGTQYVLLMPWLNLMDGLYDIRNAPWMQTVHIASSAEAIRERLIATLNSVIERFISYQDNINSKYNIIEVLSNSLGQGWILSYVLSSLLFYNPFIHGRIKSKYNILKTVKEIPSLDFHMGDRRISTLYRGLMSDGKHIMQFYNSLEMFATAVHPYFDRNSTKDASEHYNRSIEIATFGTYNSKSLKITDEFQIVPLITPVVKMDTIKTMLQKCSSSGHRVDNGLAINRDNVKFLVYDEILNSNPAQMSGNLGIPRLKAVMSRNVKKLKLIGCNVEHVESLTPRTNYMGGFSHINSLPSQMESKDGNLRAYTSINSVMFKYIDSITKGNVDVNKTEVLSWLLKFGEDHIPLLNRI